MFGPESTATDRPRTRVERRSPVAGSSPFARLRIGAVPGSASTRSPNAALGTAATMTSTSAGASASAIACAPLRSTCWRWRGFQPFSLIASACSLLRQARTTSWSRSRRRRVNAVPHAPAPTTKNRISGSFHEVDRDRHALEPELLAQLVLDPVAVVARHEAGVVDREPEAWRADADLCAVEEVETAAALPARWLPRLAQLAEGAVQLRRRDPREVPLEPATRVGRDRDERWPLTQAPPEETAHVLDVDRRLVPFRKHHERRASSVPRDVGDRDVLLDDTLGRVDEDERDVGALGRLDRAELGVVVDTLPVTTLAAQAGGVDEHERPVAALEHGVDGVARRARDLADDHALAAEQRVDEARFADVRAAEDRDPDRIVGQLRSSLRGDPFELGDDPVEQVARAVPVEGGDRDGVAEAELVELEHQRLVARVVDLVRKHEHRLARLTEDLANLLVARRHAGARVDDEENEIRFLDRLARLPGDRLRHRRRIGDVDAARVEEHEALVEPLADDLLAVARHAGCLVDDGGARLGQTVDERRLADVREADDRDRAEQWRRRLRLEVEVLVLDAHFPLRRRQSRRLRSLVSSVEPTLMAASRLSGGLLRAGRRATPRAAATRARSRATPRGSPSRRAAHGRNASARPRRERPA